MEAMQEGVSHGSTTQTDQRKAYIGTKVIVAEPMSRAAYCRWCEHESTITCAKLTMSPDHEDERGYRVYYPDSYVSWSPAGAFETAYREVGDGERDLIRSTGS